MELAHDFGQGSPDNSPNQWNQKDNIYSKEVDMMNVNNTRLLNKLKNKKGTYRIDEHPDESEDHLDIELDESNDKMLDFKSKMKRISNQDDSVSNERSEKSSKRKFLAQFPNVQYLDDTVTSEEVKEALVLNKRNMSENLANSQINFLKPTTKGLGGLLTGAYAKSKSNVTGMQDKKDVNKPSIFFKALTKKLQGKGKFMVRGSSGSSNNLFTNMKTNIANKIMKSNVLFNNEEDDQEKYKNLDDFLLSNDVDKKSSRRNEVSVSSGDPSSFDVDDSSPSSKEANNKTTRGMVESRRKGIRFREQVVQTSKIQLQSKPEPVILKKKVEVSGNLIFHEILDSLSSPNANPAKVASEYFKLAFRDTKIFHFKDKSLIKHIYFTRSHSSIQEFFCLL